MALGVFGSGCGDPMDGTSETEFQAEPRQRVYFIAAD
jgi:hypothetical protein